MLGDCFSTLNNLVVKLLSFIVYTSMEFLKLACVLKTDHTQLFYYLSCNNDIQLAIMGGWYSISICSPDSFFLILISISQGKCLLEV